jgi:hypothetical protein
MRQPRVKAEANRHQPGDGLKDRAQVSKTVTRRQGVSRVRIPPPPLISAKRLQSARFGWLEIALDAPLQELENPPFRRE